MTMQTEENEKPVMLDLKKSYFMFSIVTSSPICLLFANNKSPPPLIKLAISLSQFKLQGCKTQKTVCAAQ
jgi:hypothetical protein